MIMPFLGTAQLRPYQEQHDQARDWKMWPQVHVDITGVIMNRERDRYGVVFLNLDLTDLRH